jgi:hypothetical protein
MVTDPNWFYSTIAQSSAAIVAIVGGFVTSNILSLITEKKRLTDTLREKRNILKTYRESNVDMSIANIKLIEAEIPALEERIKYFTYPRHLRTGVLILFHFAVFSIIWPVLLIMQEEFEYYMKLFIFLFFTFGLIALISYMILLISELRRK